MTKAEIQKANQTAAAALIALDRWLDFSDPNQCYVFVPAEDSGSRKLWENAAKAVTALQSKPSS